jgi:hypothetical protein
MNDIEGKQEPTQKGKLNKENLEKLNKKKTNPAWAKSEVQV